MNFQIMSNHLAPSLALSAIISNPEVFYFLMLFCIPSFKDPHLPRLQIDLLH